jgi:hypothetical protein
MTSRNPEVAGARALVRGLVLVASLVAVSGIVAWVSPSPPPYSGRLAWVGEAAYGLLGPAGPALLWLLGAVGLLLAARFIWRHTPKRPTDRLF